MMCPRMQDLFLVVVYNLLDLFFLLFFLIFYLNFRSLFFWPSYVRMYFPQPVWGITGERFCSTRSSGPPSPDQLIDHHSALVGY